jgi:hypothetical protein
LIVGEATTRDALHSGAETLAIIGEFAIVVTERLFVKVTEKMKRFDADVSTGDTPLEKALEILKPVGMNLAVNILHGVVYHSMRVTLLKTAVGFQRIRIERSARLHMLRHFGLQGVSAAIRNDRSTNLSAPLQDSEYGSFVFRSRASDPAAALCDVHVAGLPADKGFVNLTTPSNCFTKFPVCRARRMRCAINHAVR